MHSLSKLVFWIAWVVTSVVALLSCTISNDTYVSPANNFSYDVSLISGLRTEELDCSPEGGAIAFYSTTPFERSHLYCLIGYTRLHGRQLEQLKESSERRRLLKTWLHAVAIPASMSSSLGKHRIASEEYTPLNSQDALFALIILPGASGYTANGRKVDATRGILVFTEGDYVYMIMHQLENLMVLGHVSKQSEHQRAVDSRTILGRFYKNLTFSSPN